MTKPLFFGNDPERISRISETFISNEILLLEQLGLYPFHLSSMRQPREIFSHEDIKKIRAPVIIYRKPSSLLFPGCCFTIFFWQVKDRATILQPYGPP